jgi:hypothetical protein
MSRDELLLTTAIDIQLLRDPRLLRTIDRDCRRREAAFRANE